MYVHIQKSNLESKIYLNIKQYIYVLHGQIFKDEQVMTGFAKIDHVSAKKLPICSVFAVS